MNKKTEDLSIINTPDLDDVNNKTKENNATVDKTDESYLTQLQGAFYNIRSKILKNFQYLNELGVKAPITQNLYEPNQDIEYDQEENEHIRKIRSTDEIGFTTSKFTQQIFTPTLEDKEFIKNESSLLKKNQHPINTQSGSSTSEIYYRGIIMIIDMIYSRVESTDKVLRSSMTTTIESLGSAVLPFIMQMRQYLFLVQDSKGQIGFPTKKGIQAKDPNSNKMNYNVLNDFHNIARTIDISIDILDKLQENYKKIFKRDFKQKIMEPGTAEIEKAKESFSEILSSLKPLNTNIDKTLNRFLKNYHFFDNKAKKKYFGIFNKKFSNKEDAKQCFSSMNKEFLSQHLDDFDLYKYFDSLYANLRSLNKDYQLIHNQLFGDKIVKANRQVQLFNHFRGQGNSDLYRGTHLTNFNGEVCPEIKNETISSSRSRRMNNIAIPSNLNITEIGEGSNNVTDTPYLNTTQIGEGINNVTNTTYLYTPRTGGGLNNGTMPYYYNPDKLAVGVGAFVGFIAIAGCLGKYCYSKYYGNNQAITDEEIRLQEEGKNNSLEDMTPNPNATLLQKNIKKDNTAVIQATSNQNQHRFSL